MGSKKSSNLVIVLVFLVAVAVGAEPVGQIGIVEVFAATFAFVVEIVEAVIANIDFAIVTTVDAVQIVFVVNFSTMLATVVRIVAAIVTNENSIAVSVVGVVQAVPVVNLTALSTFGTMIFNAVRADVGVINEDHLVAGVILVAVATIAEALFKAVRADVNAFAILVEDAGNGIGSAPAFVASFAAF